MAAGGPAHRRRRRGRDDRRVGGDARQRRDHERGDVLPPGTDRRSRRRHRSPGDHRDAADPAARPAALDEQLRTAVDLAAGAPDEGTVEFGIGPHAAYTVPLPVLRDAAAAAREHGMLLHLHVAETATEGADLLATHGLTVPALLAAHDVLGGRVLAAHCVHMDDGDLDLWHEYDVAVAHCPASNAKLASGIAPVRAMLDRGSGWAWAPTGRPRTTGWTCWPTCGSRRRSPGWPDGRPPR
ncbi:amidohydrolase family protein [Blastococcus brunescens]|uniref:Amidohydrolase family protein n=1 Tax=Blastococcus brunescens TaxID=1564165 RepID=A0ABZ1AY61_9ACTN|nr:amidohydrolase family protein [Blastococcus sp. BMG 8361]WRL63510.1 amidohydrolase family protein [Blastococcus sp. BMG 8361]